MKQIIVNYKKAVLWSTLVIIFQMFVFYLLWANPIVKEISAQFIHHPSIKPYEFVGGLDNWVMLRTIFHIVFLSSFIYLYLFFYKIMPGKGWKKGLYFGLLIGALTHIPEAFNQWTLIIYPSQLILLQLTNGAIALAIYGILVAVVFQKMNIIEETRNAIKDKVM
ncbi:MAG: hypothetical protein GXP08_02005 [Gammaproteobacteria bacterium]|nr:hypothetical protein [Gammaproteobacteria bacterium]